MTPEPDLFSRVNLLQMTGIPDDVLNYWMREGVLRAREGGEGRGNPRRFDYPEVMLAAILDQLRGFGLNVAALKGLAERFHTALDYFRAFNITRHNFYELQILIDRFRYEQSGHGSFGHTNCPENFPMYDWQEVIARPGLYKADIPFDELIDKPRLWSTEDATEEGTKFAIIAFNAIDLDEYDAHYSYWSTLTEIHKKRYSGQPDHFERDTTGNWHMTRGDPTGRSWISVDTSAINFELWAGDTELRD